MNIQIDLAGPTPDYAMYTDLGNAAVHALVVKARNERLSWPQTYRALCSLAEHEQFGEATDTAVREVVYNALNFDTYFYC